MTLESASSVGRVRDALSGRPKGAIEGLGKNSLMDKYYDHFIGGKSLAPPENDGYQSIEQRPGATARFHIANGTNQDVAAAVAACRAATPAWTAMNPMT